MFIPRAISLMLALCVAFPLAFSSSGVAQETETFSSDFNAAQSRKKLRRACFGDECVRIRRSKYLGDFCWEYSFDEGAGPLKLGVFHMGGGHFLLSGKVREGGTDFIVQGNAELIGEDLVILLQSVGGSVDQEVPIPDSDDTQTVSVAGAAVFSGSLDPETLDGEALLFEAAAFEEEPQGFETGLSYGGVVAFTRSECF